MGSLVLSLLAIGIIGTALILIKSMYMINKKKKSIGFLSSIGLIIFSGIIFLGIFVGIDDMRGTKLTEKAISNINVVLGNFKIREDDKLVKNESVEPDKYNSQKDGVNTLKYTSPEEIESKDETEAVEKGKETNTNISTENININKEDNTVTSSTDNTNKAGNTSSSPVDNTYPAEIVDYKLRDVGNHTTSLVYSIKNNSDKTIYTYKIIILLYDDNGKPVYVKSNGGISDNMIQEVHHDYNIYSGETKGATADIIKAENIKKVKIVISEVQYVGTSEIWVNPEINNILQNKNKF